MKIEEKQLYRKKFIFQYFPKKRMFEVKELYLEKYGSNLPRRMTQQDDISVKKMQFK